MTAVIGGIVALMFLAAVLIISAVRLSSRMSQAGIVVRPGPEKGAPFDEYDGDGNLRKRVETRYADAWRDELPLADARTRVNGR